MRFLWPVAWVVFGGCKVVDAPDTIEELMVFGFVGFEDGEPVAQAVVEELVPLAEEYEDELVEGMRIESLSQDNLDEAGVSTELRQGLVGVAARVSMESSVDDVARVWCHPEPQDVMEVTTDLTIHDEEGDRDCFVSGDCDTYTYEATRVLQMPLVGEGSQRFTRSFLRTELGDGTTAVIVRELVPDGTDMNTNLVRVDAQFSYTVFLEDGSGTLRVDGYWVDAEAIGLELPDYFALDLAVNQMNRAADEVDAFVDSE